MFYIYEIKVFKNATNLKIKIITNFEILINGH